MHRFIHHRYLRLGALALSCAAVGAGASAIASAGAATAPAHPQRAAAAHRALAPRRLIRRTVEAELVVDTRRGFVTVTIDRGIVRSTSADVLTLAVGTRKATYRTVQLTLPAASTRVRNDGHRASLDQLAAGERAIVVRGPHRALVIAHG
jgi:hypothetical protein